MTDSDVTDADGGCVEVLRLSVRRRRSRHGVSRRLRSALQLFLRLRPCYVPHFPPQEHDDGPVHNRYPSVRLYVYESYRPVFRSLPEPTM